MTLRILISLITISLLFRVSLYGQSEYKPGYIITIKGDSVKGFVNYKNLKLNTEYIGFKKDENKESIEYFPKDIRQFGTLDEKYISAIVDRDISSSNNYDLENSKNPNIRKDTVFLQTLIQGDKDLYLFVSSSGKSNFYIKIDNEYQLLIYKRYVNNNDGDKLVAENSLFKNQLAFYLSGCSGVTERLAKTKYKQNDLKKLFEEYYKCNSEMPLFDKKVEDVEMEFEIFTGASFTKLDFEGSGSEYLLKTNYNVTFKASAGASANLILPRTGKRWSIFNSILFSTYKAEGSYYKEYASYNYRTTYSNFEYSYIKLVNTIRFTHLFDKISCFVDAGMTNGIAVNGTNHFKAEITLFSDVREEEGQALEETRNYEQGLTIGTGVVLKKMSIELRYEKGNGMSVFKTLIKTLSSETNRLYLFFGYRF